MCSTINCSLTSFTGSGDFNAMKQILFFFYKKNKMIVSEQLAIYQGITFGGLAAIGCSIYFASQLSVFFRIFLIVVGFMALGFGISINNQLEAIRKFMSTQQNTNRNNVNVTA